MWTLCKCATPACDTATAVMFPDGEGVIYALSEAAANQEMGTRCGSDGDDLVLLNEQEEPTEVCSMGDRAGRSALCSSAAAA